MIGLAHAVEWGCIFAIPIVLAVLAPWEHRRPLGAEREELDQVRAKPRIRIRQDGWVHHLPGPFPFAPDCRVNVMLRNGVRWTEPAGRWPEEWWRNEASRDEHDILFYRITDRRTRREVRP